MTDHTEVHALMQQAEALNAAADALLDKRRPLLLRMLQTRRAKELNDQAQDLMDEIRVRLGLPAEERPPEKYGHFTRTGWVRLQWFIGIWNAFTMVWALYDGRWFTSVTSLLSMLACTLWVLPRKPRKIKR